MHFGSRVRGAALAMATMSAATLLMTACQPGPDSAGSAASPSGTAKKPTASPSGSPAPAKPSGGTGAPAKPAGDSSPKAPASVPATATPATKTKTCAAESLKAFMYQADVRPPGTGTGAAIVELTNMSGATCAIEGYPTVAGAANGTPEKNHPLTVTRTGSSSKVTLAPAAKAWVKMTFVQVQGEADGYCVSGTTPVTYPTLVVGLPSSGAHQLALEDGVLAECDNKVTVTAVTATKPS
ncbi:DUF4232 domain-containing protein [Streptomyces sp. NBC_00151]|uniref:DUF4232 domain-containing protein n=1 Tax=Streptomyces sp. NBC_00151 TaxID=2975669 RepID=UPI002DD8679B|nr:DUF4232 domain-containing protein [Streptomyces sp. NBC_00151]WRZ37721.1 DUF4232 domain-containing protein [Streptomyces sp. NBC_00151]